LRIVLSTIKFVEVLEGNQYNDSKTIHANCGTIKPIIINFNTKIPLKLLSIIPFHNIIIIEFVPHQTHEKIL
jgi:hypothetical protein